VHPLGSKAPVFVLRPAGLSGREPFGLLQPFDPKAPARVPQPEVLLRARDQRLMFVGHSVERLQARLGRVQIVSVWRPAPLAHGLDGVQSKGEDVSS